MGFSAHVSTTQFANAGETRLHHLYKQHVAVGVRTISYILPRHCSNAEQVSKSHFAHSLGIPPHDMSKDPQTLYAVEDGVAVITLSFPPMNALHPKGRFAGLTTRADPSTTLDSRLRPLFEIVVARPHPQFLPACSTTFDVLMLTLQPKPLLSRVPTVSMALGAVGRS